MKVADTGSLVDTTSAKSAEARWQAAKKYVYGENARKKTSTKFPGWTASDAQQGRIDNTPDLMQTAHSLGLPGNGSYYCGPVSVANAMIYLSKRGYEKLAPPGCDTAKGQSKLALDLGERMVRNCDTKANDLLVAVRDYVREKGYEIESLKYEGCEKVDKEFMDEHKRPNIDCIRRSMSDPNAVAIMTIGFYNYIKDSDQYNPMEQHDVTLVGCCEHKGVTSPDQHVVVIHDPSSRSGPQEMDEFVGLTPIKHGHWQWDNVPLTDVYKLSGELHPPTAEPYCYSLFEGVAILKLKPVTSK